MTKEELARKAVEAMGHAYAPYSGYLVGAALLTADAAEPKSCADYRAAGLPCRAAVKGPGSVAAGMKWLQSLNAIIIDPVRCPETAAEFTGYEYLRDARTGEVTNAWPDADNHHIDAVRYALESVWRRRGS